MGRPRGSKNKTHITKTKLICPVCQERFERYPSRAKDKRRKNRPVYCSRKCADKNKKNVYRERGYFGEKTANYKNGRSSYREKATRTAGLICEKCGYDGESYPTLIWVHHRDFNRENNVSENLVVLCIRCHQEVHLGIGHNAAVNGAMKTVEARWGADRNSLQI